jgi:hypothetical protein
LAVLVLDAYWQERRTNSGRHDHTCSGLQVLDPCMRLRTKASVRLSK